MKNWLYIKDGFVIKQLTEDLGRSPTLNEIKQDKEKRCLRRIHELDLTKKEQTTYNMWKKGVISEKINSSCQIWYTNIDCAPHEDRWDNIEKLTIEEAKEYLNKKYSIEQGNVFKEGSQRLISISLPEIDDEDGGTSCPAIYIPVLLLDEFKEFELKKQCIDKIN